MFLSFLVGRYYYRANVDAMRSQAETAFVDVLKQELRKKNERLKIPYSTFRRGVDTIPLYVHITTASGERKYKVNAEKSKKNLSQNFTERSLQSISLIDSPLSADILWQSWQDILRDYRIYGTIAVKIFTTDLEERLNCVEKSDLSQESVPNQFTFISYIGNRCEVEVMGKLQYTWWSVCLYHWPSFLGNIVITLIIFVFLFYLFKLKDRSSRVELVEREVVREVVSFVKEVGDVKPELYSLTTDLVFNPKRQLLIYRGDEIKLSPQSTVILKYFLDAPEYTVTDDELVKNIWGMNHGASIKNFRSASQRIYNVFDEVGFSIKFMRVGTDRYTMVFVDNQ